MGSLGRCLARGLLRGQPGIRRSFGPPRCYGSAPPELREQTLVLVKPDAVQRRLVGDVIGRFERRGFKLVAMKLLQADRGLLDQHYQHLQQKPFYPALLAYMTSGPLVAMVWEGYNVVRSTRAMVGDTDSAKAAAGTIRGDLSMHVSRNVVHASDSVETALKEIGFWFQRDELVAWECGDSQYTPAPLQPGPIAMRRLPTPTHAQRAAFRAQTTNPGVLSTSLPLPACLAVGAGGDEASRRALRGRGSLSAAKMAAERGASQAPADVESDECLAEYRHLYSPDILQGRVAFITGGGSGIGFRIAEVFMRHGCRTVIAGRNQQRVAEPQTIVAAVDETLKQFKQIDILVNGAAGNFLCPASALSFNAFKTVMDIDTLGTFNTSKVLFEKYFRDHGGVIVNITATLSYRGQALQVHAGSAKAAIDAMTRHLAVEWGPNNIRVNSLAPGPITGTEGFRRLGGKFAQDSNQFDTIPLQRAGNKTEIAHSALYLASPLSSYVTGTTLVVDGGSWLTSANSFSALLDVWAAGANKNQ